MQMHISGCNLDRLDSNDKKGICNKEAIIPFRHEVRISKCLSGMYAYEHKTLTVLPLSVSPSFFFWPFICLSSSQGGFYPNIKGSKQFHKTKKGANDSKGQVFLPFCVQGSCISNYLLIIKSIVHGKGLCYRWFMDHSPFTAGVGVNGLKILSALAKIKSTQDSAFIMQKCMV